MGSYLNADPMLYEEGVEAVLKANLDIASRSLSIHGTSGESSAKRGPHGEILAGSVEFGAVVLPDLTKEVK